MHLTNRKTILQREELKQVVHRLGIIQLISNGTALCNKPRYILFIMPIICFYILKTKEVLFLSLALLILKR